MTAGRQGNDIDERRIRQPPLVRSIHPLLYPSVTAACMPTAPPGRSTRNPVRLLHAEHRSLREPNTDLRPPKAWRSGRLSHDRRTGTVQTRGRTHFSCHSGPVSRPGPRGAGVSRQRGRAPAGAPGGHCTYPAVARQRSATRTSSAPQHALRLRSRPCPISSCPSRLRAARRTSRRLTAGRGQAHIREGRDRCT